MTRKTDASIERKVLRLYTSKTVNGWMGAQSIAEIVGVSSTTVQNILVRNGVPLRDAKEAHALGKRCKPIKNMPNGTAPLCKCGCGRAVTWNRRKNRWNAFVEGHYRKDLPYKDRDWLEAEYRKGRTQAEIAEQFGVIRSVISKFFRKFSLPVRPHSETLKLRGSSKGSKNPAWKGGVTPERQRLQKTGEWIKLVKYVYKRDGHKCQRCGVGQSSKVSFHAHHIHSFAVHPELRLDPANLVTLCETCHLWVHSHQNIHREFLAP